MDETEERYELRRGRTDNAPKHLQTGAWGEELAMAYLREKGYVILKQDWRSRHVDIDMVAQQGDCIVFIEVKTRHYSDLSHPLDAVDSKKQRNLLHAISNYLQYYRIDNPWRFDVITIVGEMGSSLPEIKHTEDFPLADAQTTPTS